MRGASTSPGGSPAAAYFLLIGQEKVSKEKAAPVRRSCGLPCAARHSGRLRNSSLSLHDKDSDSARRHPPMYLCCSAAPSGKRKPNGLQLVTKKLGQIGWASFVNLIGSLTPSSAVRGTCASSWERQVRGGRLKSLRQPDFNNRLPCNAEFAGFTIEGINHPGRKINIHSFLLLQSALGFG